MATPLYSLLELLASEGAGISSRGFGAPVGGGAVGGGPIYPVPSTREAPELARFHGDVVGTGWKQAGFGDQTAWAYIHDQFIDLNDVIDPMSGWHLIAANDINDNGDVVGRGTLNGVQKAFRLRLPLRTAGGKGPTLAEAHTYGYDGLRTSTTTMNVDGTNVKSQYWFSQDYTETVEGNREHYIRVGVRIVAKVTMAPTGSAFVPPVSVESGDKNDTGGGWPKPLVALALALCVLAGAGYRLIGKRKGWVPATAGVLTLLFTVASCEMFGVNQKIAAWTATAAKTLYFHNGIAPGPTVLTNSTGAVWQERRYEPFGQPIDAAGLAGAQVDFQTEPQNSLGKMTNLNTGWSYHGARWMAPQTARWSAPDSAIKGPDPKHLFKPWDLNPYGYVAQQPTLHWDPDGKEYPEASYDAFFWASVNDPKLREINGKVSIALISIPVGLGAPLLMQTVALVSGVAHAKNYVETGNPQEAGRMAADLALAWFSPLAAGEGVLLAGSRGAAGDGEAVAVAASTYRVSASRAAHILEGAPAYPGARPGHGHGPGRGYTMGAFPDTWTDAQAIAAIERVASSPKSTWTCRSGPNVGSVSQGGPAPGAATTTNPGTPVRYAVRGQDHGLDIEVIVAPTGEGIITGYTK
jgi:RHS repeat-associated protein